MQRLDPRVIDLWRVQGLLRVLTFWLPLAVGVGGVVWTQVGAGPAVAVAGGLLSLQIALALAWPPLAWRRFGYEVRGGDLLVEKGVFFRNLVSIPLDRIQHVDTRQGPIEQAWGRANLVVYTAAGMAADGTIPGLAPEEAARLRDQLILRRGDGGI